MNQKKLNNKGFSLVELIIVIAIMAVLVAVLAPQYIKYVEKSRVQVDESAVGEAIRATELAITDITVYDKLPTTVITGKTYVATVTITDGTTITSTVDELAAEVKNTVGDSITMKSKTHDGETYTIEVNYDSTNNSFSVVPYNASDWS